MVLLITLLRPCLAALSIQSGYEKFIHDVRSRVVVHESDTRIRKETICRSLSGPLCHINKTRALENFSLIDSVVSQRLFDTEELKNAASQALNEFLSTNPVKSVVRAETVDDQLEMTESGVDTVRFVGESVTLSLNGSWSVYRDQNQSFPVLQLPNMARMRFDTPVLITSLVMRGKGSVRGRYKKAEQWRADAFDRNECKVGSFVVFRSRQQTHIGTVLFYSEGIAYIKDVTRGTSYTRLRSQIVSVTGRNCESLLDTVSQPEELVLWPSKVVDEIFFVSDDGMDLMDLHIRTAVRKEQASLRENFIIVFPNYYMIEMSQSILTPLLTVDDMEQRGLELVAKKFDFDAPL